MKKLLLSVMLTMSVLCGIVAQESYSGTVVADEGAWCWFADPRALHYTNAAGTINATYIGYIDVHGNVKATQYDWLTGKKTDVLIRSYFQPDDHNNPTFIVLPDERVMIFYTRHTDEAKIWYRISQKPGDIAAMGEEKFLTTANNTTYPSPFILSDDPNHIYLCWRGINWHPTIARLTIPDAAGDCRFDFGPKQIVQSTGARPYAKYHSNGKDKIYVSYTTGHPDNEMPNWLYFNVVDINQGNGPILRDLNGEQLSVIADGVFNVNKNDSYVTKYPATIVDKTPNIRNWVWQITLDENENPVVAYPQIDNNKMTHVYWYARWTGSGWKNTKVQNGGHAFHQNWNNTELCYSGGMSIDPDNINDLYLSIPTKDGVYNKDGVYEIWKYTIDNDGKVAGSEQITRNSSKNNVRPFIIPGSKDSKMRLTWMNGDYYYWIVRQGYPLGYPTGIRCDYAWEEELTTGEKIAENITFGKGKTLNVAFAMNTSKYEGVLLSVLGEDGKELTYSINAADQCPVLAINGKAYKGSNRLLTSDDWATKSTGTSGDNHPTKLTTLVLTLTYDGTTLTIYRNGLIDQVIETVELAEGTVTAEGDNYNHSCISIAAYDACYSQASVQFLVKESDDEIQAGLIDAALNSIILPAETRTDLVLHTEVLNQSVKWTSSDETVITSNGVLISQSTDSNVTLTASIGDKNKTFEVKALARDITKNLLYSKDGLNLTSNTASGFATNKYEVAPEGLLCGVRSFTFLLTVNAKSLTNSPRFYDFGSASGNSLFLRANQLSAGVKYNGGTTTMVSSNTTLKTNKDYKLAVTYDANTKTTKIYIDGEEDASGTANQVEAYQLEELAKDARNYIGRTQWWDTDSEKAKNVDFVGTIDGFRMYNVCLTRKEICELQSLTYKEKELPTTVVNGDFEGKYTKQASSGVSSDRAIYVPEGWTVDRINPNENDITALKSSDLYFNYFANKPAPSEGNKQTYWIRHNWGTPTLTLSQEIRLPEGEYTLEADVWKSGSGGDAVISVIKEGGATAKSPTLSIKEEWQKVTIDFKSDGIASTTVQLAAIHTENGQETIIGFDNVSILYDMPDTPDKIDRVYAPSAENAVYNLAGQKVLSPTNKGIYISGGKKIIVY